MLHKREDTQEALRAAGHRMGPWGTSRVLRGHQEASCTRCGHKAHLGPNGQMVGEVRACDGRGNDWHRPDTRLARSEVLLRAGRLLLGFRGRTT